MKVEYLVCDNCKEKMYEGQGLTLEYEGPTTFAEITEWNFHDWKCLAAYSDLYARGYNMK